MLQHYNLCSEDLVHVCMLYIKLLKVKTIKKKSVLSVWVTLLLEVYILLNAQQKKRNHATTLPPPLFFTVDLANYMLRNGTDLRFSQFHNDLWFHLEAK